VAVEPKVLRPCVPSEISNFKFPSAAGRRTGPNFLRARAVEESLLVLPSFCDPIAGVLASQPVEKTFFVVGLGSGLGLPVKFREGWRYKEALVNNFPFGEFWASVPGTIPTHRSSQQHLVALYELGQFPRLATIIAPGDEFFPFLRDRHAVPNPEWTEPTPAIFRGELDSLPGLHRKEVFRQRKPVSGHWLPSGHLVITWTKETTDCTFDGPPYQPSYLVELPNEFAVGFGIHSTGDTVVLESVLLKLKNPLIQRLTRLKAASMNGGPRYPAAVIRELARTSRPSDLKLRVF
jgi:hypothetical protein